MFKRLFITWIMLLFSLNAFAYDSPQFIASGSSGSENEFIETTIVSTTPYTVLETDHALLIISAIGPVTISIPNAIETNGRILSIKDQSGHAVANTITIESVANKLFDGKGSCAITEAFGEIDLLFDTNSWSIMSRHPSSFMLYNDLRISPNNLPDLGPNHPIHKIIANDGSATTGIASSFDGTNYGEVVDYAALDVASLSIACWTHIEDLGNHEILDRNGSGGFEFYMSNGDLSFSVGDGGNVSSGGIVAGASQFLCVTAEDSGTNLLLKLYINGTLIVSRNRSSQLATLAVGLSVGQYHTGGWLFNGVIDNLQLYNTALTAEQVTELYNTGEGMVGVPTGITEATDLVASFFTNETSGQLLDNYCTLGADYDIDDTGHTLTEVDGLIGVSSGSLGVVALAFPDSIMTSTYFTAQLPHSYYEGEDIMFHVHWHVPAGTGDVVWGLEWEWVNTMEELGNTTVSPLACTVEAGIHNVDDIVTMDGTGKTISSMILGRLFRDGTNGAVDTYVGEAFISEADFHYPMDAEGSTTQWAK